MGLNRWLGCIENPRTGRESQGVGLSRPASRRKNVMVVGAGPAGLQAAIAAARNGHTVTVYEKEPVPGGQVRLAASVPNRAEFGDMIRNQIIECQRLGVTLEYGVGVWPGLVEEKKPDHVVVAMGAEAQRPWWVPGDAPRVCDVREVLSGTASPSGSVVVVDEIGFHHATSVGELLADRGCNVEIVTPGMVVGQDLGITPERHPYPGLGGARRSGQPGGMAVQRPQGRRVERRTGGRLPRTAPGTCRRGRGGTGRSRGLSPRSGG
mgnify:CR=1 FL=1